MDSIENAIRLLEDIDASVSGDQVADSSTLALKTHKLAQALKTLSESGKGMSDVDMFPISPEMLQFLDNNVNLDAYRLEAYKNTKLEAERITRRMHYLQKVESSLKDLTSNNNA